MGMARQTQIQEITNDEIEAAGMAALLLVTIEHP